MNLIDLDVKAMHRKKRQVQRLLTMPKIEQKTQEWYNARNNLITASDFAQALGHGKFGTQKQLIEKKVILDDFKVLNNPFFEWGNLFEPVACDVYSHMHSANVHEFGLIRHPKYNYFGASPDGITDEGIMLEIKCPFKRKITGEIPLQYYYQIQGQLDVCELDECDYFECEFSKYTSYDDYKNEYGDGLYTGVISTQVIDGKKSYVYMGVQNGMCNKHRDEDAMYWVLKKYLLKRVIKDEEFLSKNLHELKKVWDKIIEYRNDKDKFELEVKKKCMLDTEVLVETFKHIAGNVYNTKTVTKSNVVKKGKNIDKKIDKSGCLIIDLE